MAKLTTRDIRERTIALLQVNSAGLRYKDIVRTISADSPETPFNTIMTQVGEVPTRHPELVFRPEPGLFQIRSNADMSTPLRQPKPTLPRTTATLKSLGFVHAGTWTVAGPHLRCDFVDHAERSPVLYAFVVAGEVVYLGKSVMPLGKRIGHYARPGVSQLTNLRVNARMRDVLAGGEMVGVWALVDWEAVEHRGIPVNVASGIEDALIERMAPPWNGGSRAREVRVIDSDR